MTLEQQWIEYDFNQFILFSFEGKVLSLNAEAQFLIGSVSVKELFKLATTYAGVTYGFKTTFTDIEFGRYKFFGLTVGYIDDNEIGLKLYRFPTFNPKNLKKPDGELTNIYTVIDLCISSNSIGNDIEFKKDYDPTIPDIIIDSNKLVKVLNQTYKCFLNNKTIHTKVFYRIGEHIRYDDKKYSLFSIKVYADSIDTQAKQELKELINSTCFYVETKDSTITINLPIITS
jgi:hypothetical protein